MHRTMCIISYIHRTCDFLLKGLKVNPDIFSRSVSFGCSEFNNDSDLTLDKAVKIAHAVETGRVSKDDGYALALLIDRGYFSGNGRVESD